MRGNRRSAGTIQPEFLARIGSHGNKALAATGVGKLDDMRSGFTASYFVVRYHVGQQDHFWAFVAVGLGGITHRLDVARIEMFQASQDGIRMCVQIVFDFDNRGHGLAHLAEKFQTHRTGECGQLVQNKTGGSNDAVAAFLLDTR